MFSLVLTCSRLFSLVLTCSHLFSLVLTCSHLVSLVLACSHLFSLVLTWSHFFLLVLAWSHLGSLLAGWLGWPGWPRRRDARKIGTPVRGWSNLLGGPTRLLDSNCRTVQDLGRMVHVKHRGCLPAWICTSDQSWLRGTVHWHPRQGTSHSRGGPRGARRINMIYALPLLASLCCGTMS